jgi:xanthine dehydrogenase/oxidase
MSLYAVLRNATARGSLTVDDVELEGALDGNLCRCTGYKPILDAAKTFVGDYMKGLQKGRGSEADRDFVVPVNLEAANLDEERDIKVPGRNSCCEAKPEDLSTDSEFVPYLMLYFMHPLYS